MEFLGEMLTIAVFPPKRHQFHDANFFKKKKIRKGSAQYLSYAIIHPAKP